MAWRATTGSASATGVQGSGELRVNPSDFERFTTPGPRNCAVERGVSHEIQLKKGRCGKCCLLCTKELTAAAPPKRVGHELLVSADDRRIGRGEFHLLDLTGLEARLAADGTAIGTVSDLISGGNDLLEITTSGGRKLLIPFVEAIVPEVQLEDGWLLLTPPGLLDL